MWNIEHTRMEQKRGNSLKRIQKKQPPHIKIPRIKKKGNGIKIVDKDIHCWSGFGEESRAKVEEGNTN